MPTPNKGESKDKFISRCIDELVTKEGYEQKQATAICYSKWENKGKKKAETPLVFEHFQNEAWALLPEKLEEITAFMLDRMQGGNLVQDIADFKAAAASRDPFDSPYYVLNANGIATIQAIGLISKRMNLLSNFSGGTSVELLRKSVEAAVQDPDVRGIFLYVDSPGGSASGVKEFSDYLAAARQIKPVLAFTDGLMCSAAYWLSSGTTELHATDMATVGSIGVVYTHVDYSKQDEARGIKRTHIYAGKYKVMGSEDEPLTKEAKSYIQDMVDTYYGIFVDSVATNRGLTTQQVLTMADAKTYIGKKAKEAGLVDAIGSRELAMERLLTLVENNGGLRAAASRAGQKGPDSSYEAHTEAHSTSVGQQEKGGKTSMNIEELKSQHPELYAQVKAEGEQVAQTRFDAEKQKMTVDFESFKTDTNTRIKVIEDRNLQLEKENAIRAERDREAVASQIWDKKLTGSNIPDTLHAKVRNQVKYTAFVKDDVLDTEAFSAAVDTEIKSWEEPLANAVMGQGTAVKTVDNDGKAKETATEDATVKRMLTYAGEKVA